ncbi:hypothetical protein IU433_05775 [Nocardia puris]|uniref:hypothetical protein n=1 Tax=Nocardia puris TaxID=208602 RepID=UPI00082FA3E2|nr:hypothetical protein [Nocardia puris]MBF6209538.1 hypothetical protein [Nocardia puris]MBF6366110.1 hypothetical protein [Nocardia puris]MBF6458549.1 hypothetical protein [Nocardia puris]
MEQTRAEAKAQLLAVMPEPVAETTLDILGAPTEDERRVSPDIANVLGRAARPFEEWAHAHIAAFG